jgi:hypothetical protein
MLKARTGAVLQEKPHLFGWGLKMPAAGLEPTANTPARQYPSGFQKSVWNFVWNAVSFLLYHTMKNCYTQHSTVTCKWLFFPTV